MALNDTLSIDIARRGTIHIPAKQADHGYDIICTILRNGENIVDASTDTATFRVGKPDNTIYYGDATVNADNTVTIHVDDEGQMLAVPGFVVVDVTLNDGNGVVKSTQNFVLDVQAAPGGEAIPSWSVFVELEELVAEAREAIPAVPAAVEAANAAAENANASAENANAAAQHSVRYDTPQTLTTAQQKQARENIDALEPDGYYEGLTSGNAEQLLSSIAVTDKTPYLFRHAGGNNDIGNRETVKAVTGGSVAWNQIVPNGNFAEDDWGYLNVASHSVSNNVLTFTANSYRGSIYRNVNLISGHKYMFAGDIKLTTATKLVRVGLLINNGNEWSEYKFTQASTDWQTFTFMSSPTLTSGSNAVRVRDERIEGWDAIQVRNVMLFDLTLLFGTAIADYVYSLEQANAGSGIAWLKSYGYFTQDYYPYTEPVMKHVSGLVSHDMVGFNQWDEEWELGAINWTTGEKTASSSQIRSKNYIPVLPNTTYSVTLPALSSTYLRRAYYDSDKNFISVSSFVNGPSNQFITPSNCAFVLFGLASVYGTTYKNDICINLSHSGYRNGEYEPYVKHSYALDSTVTLRGIPKLDASNNLYYDGDTYQSDGTVTRRYGVITLDGTHGAPNASVFGGSANNVVVRWVLGSPAKAISATELPHAMCDKLVPCNASNGGSFATWKENSSLVNTFTITTDGDKICIAFKETSITDVPSLNAYLSSNPITIVYELATPTEETAAPYSEIQICDDFGTEEFVVAPDSDGFQMPVGHETDYMSNLRDKLQRLPNLPDADGTYLVQYSNRQCSFIQYIAPTGLPSAPSGDGTYVLKATVADGAVTYSWVAE